MGDKTTTGLNVPVQQDFNQADYEQVRKLMTIDPTDKVAYLNYAYTVAQKTLRATSLSDTAPLSLANRYSLFTWFGLHGMPKGEVYKYYRDDVNNSYNPLTAPAFSRDPTPQNIIEFFNERYGGIEYAWSDFLWAKYNDKIANNYMLTLRRFAMPCEDNIYDVRRTTSKNENQLGDIQNVTVPDLARALTWMSDITGNDLTDILSFGYGYNWKEQTGETNTYQSQNEGYTAQPFYSKLGNISRAVFDTMKGISPGEKYRRERMAGHDPLMETYENFVIGPVNVINKMQTRDIGLNFTHDIEVNFEYELRAYSDLNPRIAMLDIFANLLVLTYSNANFWGGANRFYGGNGYIASQFGDIQKLISGDFKGYLGSVVTDLSGGFKNTFGTAGGTFTFDSVLDGLEKVGGTFLGNMLGGFLNSQIGAAPAYQAVKALITGEPTGNWHLTVGNPMNPIAMFGNLILKDSNISFKGPLGYDDFPSIIQLKCNLSHARPRDKSDFESAFNAGMGRLYASADSFPDILNLEGKDIEVYGAIQGKGGHTASGSKGSGQDGSILTPGDAETALRYGATDIGISQENQEKAAQNSVHFTKWTTNKVKNLILSNEGMIHT